MHCRYPCRSTNTPGFSVSLLGKGSAGSSHAPRELGMSSSLLPHGFDISRNPVLESFLPSIVLSYLFSTGVATALSLEFQLLLLQISSQYLETSQRSFFSRMPANLLESIPR